MDYLSVECCLERQVFNSGLIVLGLLGILSSSASALLHNASTIALGLNSTTKLITDKNVSDIEGGI